jgi:hypothetical protein
MCPPSFFLRKVEQQSHCEDLKGVEAFPSMLQGAVPKYYDTGPSEKAACLAGKTEDTLKIFSLAPCPYQGHPRNPRLIPNQIQIRPANAGKCRPDTGDANEWSHCFYSDFRGERNLRTADAPNGTSINAPANQVDGSGTTPSTMSSLMAKES